MLNALFCRQNRPQTAAPSNLEALVAYGNQSGGSYLHVDHGKLVVTNLSNYHDEIPSLLACTATFLKMRSWNISPRTTPLEAQRVQLQALSTSLHTLQRSVFTTASSPADEEYKKVITSSLEEIDSKLTRLQMGGARSLLMQHGYEFKSCHKPLFEHLALALDQEDLTLYTTKEEAAPRLNALILKYVAEVYPEAQEDVALEIARCNTSKEGASVLSSSELQRVLCEHSPAFRLALTEEIINLLPADYKEEPPSAFMTAFRKDLETAEPEWIFTRREELRRAPINCMLFFAESLEAQFPNQKENIDRFFSAAAEGSPVSAIELNAYRETLILLQQHDDAIRAHRDLLSNFMPDDRRLIEEFAPGILAEYDSNIQLMTPEVYQGLATRCQVYKEYKAEIAQNLELHRGLLAKFNTTERRLIEELQPGILAEYEAEKKLLNKASYKQLVSDCKQYEQQQARFADEAIQDLARELGENASVSPLQAVLTAVKETPQTARKTGGALLGAVMSPLNLFGKK